MAKSIVLPRLVDMATAIDNIEDAIGGKDFGAFKQVVVFKPLWNAFLSACLRPADTFPRR